MKGWKVSIIAVLVTILLSFSLAWCGEPKFSLGQYQELEKKYQVLQQDVKILKEEAAQQKAQEELARQKAEAYEKGRAAGFSEGREAGFREDKAAGYREGWDACYQEYRRYWPSYSPYLTYPPYPTYPARFTATVYQGENFEGGYVGTFEDPYPINHNWEFGGPFGLTDYFSIKWEGGAWFETGYYRFRTCADDGVRLYIDSHLVIDKWFPQVATPYEVRQYLTQGYHQIRLEYFDRTAHAVISLYWERITYDP